LVVLGRFYTKSRLDTPVFRKLGKLGKLGELRKLGEKITGVE